VYSIPDDDIFIDGMYNLCDVYGTLYEQDGYTITFADYVVGNVGSLRRRQYPGILPPPSQSLLWSEMDRVWSDNTGSIGIKGSYAYTKTVDGGAVGAGPGGADILFCQTPLMQRRRQTIPAGQQRVEIATRFVGKQVIPPTVPKIPFRR
jgi:hypothetical protein